MPTPDEARANFRTKRADLVSATAALSSNPAANAEQFSTARAAALDALVDPIAPDAPAQPISPAPIEAAMPTAPIQFVPPSAPVRP
jgi:hypothetical protein